MGRVLVGMPLAAGALFAAVALGGCEADGTPGGTAAPSTSATATGASLSPSTGSASPSASASVGIPPAAREKSEAGAEDFTRFFVAQSAVAWTTPDPALITALSDPSCESCASLATTAEQLKKRN